MNAKICVKESCSTPGIAKPTAIRLIRMMLRNATAISIIQVESRIDSRKEVEFSPPKFSIIAPARSPYISDVHISCIKNRALFPSGDWEDL